jgi:DUF971 family protein
MSEDIFPDEVKLVEAERRLDITWSNGHKSPFTLEYVRGWCPCAVCQGHFQEEWKYQEVANPQLMDVQPVGNYGMKLVWGDGHDTGIYQFDVLWAICTCEVCDPDGARAAERVRPRFMLTPGLRP